MAFVGPTSNDWAWPSRRPLTAAASAPAEPCATAAAERVGRGLPTLVGSVVVALAVLAAVVPAIHSLF